MTDFEQQNSSLKAEADAILRGQGLFGLLNKYGRTTVTGSYLLDTMTRRDLDIYVECSTLVEEQHFRLGGDIASLLRPVRMQFRNAVSEPVPGLPLGFYWGIKTSFEKPDAWNLDIWCLAPDCASQNLSFQRDLRTRITSEHRITIMALKNKFQSHPDYCKRFRSLDIYNAVLDENIITIEQFANRLRWMGIEPNCEKEA